MDVDERSYTRDHKCLNIWVVGGRNGWFVKGRWGSGRNHIIRTLGSRKKREAAKQLAKRLERKYLGERMKDKAIVRIRQEV